MGKSKTKYEPTIVGQRIFEARDSSGLTQEELAERAGVSRETIAKLESGERKRAALSTLEAIAPILHVSVDFLRGEVHESPIEPQIQEYLRHEYAGIDKPTEEEIAWFRGKDSLFWRGLPADPESLHKLILLHRKDTEKL